MTKTIGILGGMGPEATVHLFELIVKLTKAESDQDHIASIVYNNSKIPDRTDAIINRGPSPLPHLIESAKVLEKAGVDFILMPCVTAHYYYDEIIKNIGIPFLHLLEEVLRYIEGELTGVKKIGLLATVATIKSKLFHDLFDKKGLEIVVPGKKGQGLLMKALYQEGVKSGHKELPKKMMLEAVKQLEEQNVGAIIAGCTEIPLLLNQADMAVPFVNPLRIIAIEAIHMAGGSVAK